MSSPEHVPEDDGGYPRPDNKEPGDDEEGDHVLVRPPLPQGVQGPPVHPPERRLFDSPRGEGDGLDLVPGPPPHFLHQDIDVALLPLPDQVVVLILLCRLQEYCLDWFTFLYYLT